MSKTAFIFPGQGSQYVGMGRDIYDDFPLARQILEQADRYLGMALSELCFNGPEEELNSTLNTQPAILAVSYALYKLLEEGGIRPQMVAGHSLGEYSALLAAGAADFESVLLLVRERARLMQEACTPGVGAMAAVIGLEREGLLDICGRCSKDGQVVEAANFNCPGQIVVAGQKAAVEKVMALAKEKGAKLVTMLAVSIPSHCSLMSEAGEKLRQRLEQLKWRDPRIPLVANTQAAAISERGALKTALVKQLSSPVYWEDSIRAMLAQGVDTFIEAGPGSVLAKLLKRIDRKAVVHSANNTKSLKELLG